MRPDALFYPEKKRRYFNIVILLKDSSFSFPIPLNLAKGTMFWTFLGNSYLTFYYFLPLGEEENLLKTRKPLSPLYKAPTPRYFISNFFQSC